jgi:hypothetical protein
MSRDIFVQDIPPGISTAQDIPNDFRPRSGIVTRAAVLEALRTEAPESRIDNFGWAIVSVPNVYHIEVDLSGDELLDGFAFHVSGGPEADRLIAKVLHRLQLRAFDTASESGLFNRELKQGAI